MINNNEFVGIKIIPMREFWIDCYSTAIFSLLLSFSEMEQNYIYNNNYVYHYDVNGAKDFGRIYIKMQIEKIVDRLLIEKEEHDFSNDDNFLDNLKAYFDKGKVIMLGIDMYYGVSDTSQWQRHHIKHYILVEGYDDTKEVFFILETGENGYMEYEMSYDQLERAAKGFMDVSYAYSINNDFSDKMYDMTQIQNNARNIISSINEMINSINNIWHPEKKYILSMRDEIDTHLKSMANRQKANSLLFETQILKNVYPDYSAVFNVLEKDYFDLRQCILNKCNTGQYYESEMQIKKQFRKLLEQEKVIWESVCEHK